MSCLERAWKLSAPTSLFALCVLSIWVFLNYILYNKLMISQAFNSNNHSKKLENLRGCPGNL